ncbi:MAG: flagellar hook capping FlgD N-terminal domain-containing protein [Fibrobacterota bacterium]
MSTTTAATKTPDPSLDLDQYMQNLSSKKDSTASTTKAKSGTLGKDDFMTLLVTQLRYQDPLNPQDNSQMASQMAQFSSLESMQNVQKAGEALGTTFTNMGDKQAESAAAVTSSSATSMIGKSVRFKQENVSRPDIGGDAKLSIHADSGSVLLISDADGNPVRTILLGGTNDDGTDILNSLGDGTVSWDGKDDTGKYAKSGSYTIAVKDPATLDDTGYAFQDSTINSVTFDGQGPMLQTGTQSFRMKDLVEVHAAKTSVDGTTTTPTTTTTATETGASTAAALAMVGHTARFRDASAELATSTTTGKREATWTFSAQEGAVGQILDSDGNVVMSFAVDGKDSTGTKIMDPDTATGSYTWNGKDADENTKSTGAYFLRIVDPTGQKTAGTAFLERKIDSLAFDTSGNPKLVTGNIVWSFSDLFTIN